MVDWFEFMISDIDHDLSEKEMLSFFNSIPRPLSNKIGLMGGWAVTYLLRKRHIDHIGSRDIDVFFDANAVEYDFVTSLIKTAGFEPHSTFRWAKYFDRESREVLSIERSKQIESFNLVTIFLDVAAPEALDHVLYEPLLKEVFSGKCESWITDSTLILMPDILVMTKIKIKSLLERVDSFKREKDMADLLSMLRNVPELWEMRNGMQVGLRRDLKDSRVGTLKKMIPTYSVDGTISRAVQEIGMSIDMAIQILNRS